MFKTPHTIILSILVLTGLPVSANESPEQIQSIEVKGIRTRLVSYKEPYELAKKVQASTEGRVALGLRLVPTRPEVRIDDVKLWLESSEESFPIRVSEGGIFVVPVKDEIAARNWQFAINKQKGDLTARVVIIPAVPRNAWTIAMVRKAISDARVAVDKFTPWYQKPFAMRVHTVSICTKVAGVPVKIVQGESVIATLRTEDKTRNDADQQVYCLHLNGNEQYDQASLLAVPDDAEVLFL